MLCENGLNLWHEGLPSPFILNPESNWLLPGVAHPVKKHAKKQLVRGFVMKSDSCSGCGTYISEDVGFHTCECCGNRRVVVSNEDGINGIGGGDESDSSRRIAIYMRARYFLLTGAICPI